MLVSEPHTEINAGWICVGTRRTRPSCEGNWIDAARAVVLSRASFLGRLLSQVWPNSCCHLGLDSQGALPAPVWIGVIPGLCYGNGQTTLVC